MKLKIEESKLKPKTMLGEIVNIRDMDTMTIVKKLEDNIKLRETPILERLKDKLKK